MEKDLSIKQIQSCIRKIDYKKDLKDKYMLKLMEEVGELAEAVRKKDNRITNQTTIKGTIEEELVDVLYYIVCLANINVILIYKNLFI